MQQAGNALPNFTANHPQVTVWSGPVRRETGQIMHVLSPYVSILLSHLLHDQRALIWPIVLGLGSPNSFDYDLNTTFCNDQTVCPFPNNTECCNKGQGIKEIRFNDQNLIPTKAADLSAYYASAGYTIPPGAIAEATQTGTVAPSATAASTTQGNHQPQQAGVNGTSLVPQGLSTGAKAGIGVGVPIGACLFGCLLYALIKQRLNRHQEMHQQEAMAMMPMDPDRKSELAEDAAVGETALGEIDGKTTGRKLHELPPPEKASGLPVHELSTT